MAHAFTLAADGEHLTGRLDAGERELVTTVLGQVRHLLVVMDPPLPESSGDPLADSLAFLGAEPQPQDDPALRRLFPDAQAQDPTASDDFRRVTETSLRQRKVATIDIALAALEKAGNRTTLTVDDARALTMALTDVRLVLGARLGLTADDDHERLVALADDGALDAETEHGLHLYEFLTWLQEGLAEALAERWERAQAARGGA